MFELESGLKQKLAALYQNVFVNEMPRCSTRFRRIGGNPFTVLATGNRG